MSGSPVGSSAPKISALRDATRIFSMRAGRARAQDVSAALRVADAAMAAAVAMLQAISARGGVEGEVGLPAEMWLRLDGRLVGWDARAVCAAAETLAAMPATADAFAAGGLSWSQVRGVTRAASSLSLEQRAKVDAAVAARMATSAASEPEAVIDAADEQATRMREASEARREARLIEGRWLAVQRRIDGMGGCVYGEADAAGIATIVEALDAAAAAPVDRDAPPALSRGQQWMDALIGICATSLTGNAAGGAGPRPRFLATVDVADPAGARLLAGVYGGPLRVTRLTAEMLLCDAEIVPIVFSGDQPVGVGNTTKNIPDRVRAALVARDGGCRFPGCAAPAGWTQAHHITPRPYGDASVHNLGLFCSRCHHRIHRHGWTILLHPDATMSFTLRGHTYTSHSRSRPPPGG